MPQRNAELPDVGEMTNPGYVSSHIVRRPEPTSPAMRAAPSRSLTHAPWHGALALNAAERASLRVDRIVTDELIDDLVPILEYIAFFGPLKIDTETRRVWQDEARRQADTARAFGALLDNPTRLGHNYFVGRWIARGLPREDAERRIANLLTDLDELETHLRQHANDANPRLGTKADTHVDHLVRGAASSWRQHTGQPPDTSDSSAFVKFCLALAALAELPMSRDRVRGVLTPRL
jgi:hypothetical protein